MADIRKLAPLILKWEGLFVHDPADAGGPTHIRNQSIANLLIDWVWMSGKAGINSTGTSIQRHAQSTS